MDLRQIEYFLCLYKEGNITRAAAQLGLVQSALSTQISRLEKDLKVLLFNRTSRGVTPTAVGHDLHKMLFRLSNEVESVRQRIHDLSGEPSGLVKVGTVPSLGVNIVPSALASFYAQHPNVTIQLTEAYSADLIERVEQGSLDFALTNNPKQLGNLDFYPVVNEELVLVVSSNSTLATSDIIDFDQIPPNRLIVPTSEQGLRAIIDVNLSRTKQILKPHFEINALAPTIELVKTGNWAAILPVSAIARELQQGEVRISRIKTTISRDLIAVYHPKRPLSLAAQSLYKELQLQANKVVDLANKTLSAIPASRN